MNTMDEMNPNILNAEMDFVSTPETEKYKTPSYDALKSVQDKCSNDFLTNCLLPSIPTFVNPENTLTMTFSTNRRLSNEYADAPLLSVKHQLHKINDATSLVFTGSIKKLPLDVSKAQEQELVEQRKKIVKENEHKFKVQVESLPRARSLSEYLFFYIVLGLINQ